jgi:hypothetical protein
VSGDSIVRAGILKKLWFQNLVAGLIAIGALVAGISVDVLRRPSYAEYFDTRFPHTIARGQTAEIEGQNWTLGEVRHLGKAPLARYPAPPGTEIFVARIVRTGTSTTTELCSAFLTEGDRRWTAEPAYGSDFWVKPPDDGTTQDCRKPGSLQFSFLLPVDAKTVSIDIVNLSGTVKVRLAL